MLKKKTETERSVSSLGRKMYGRTAMDLSENGRPSVDKRACRKPDRRSAGRILLSLALAGTMTISGSCIAFAETSTADVSETESVAVTSDQSAESAVHTALDPTPAASVRSTTSSVIKVYVDNSEIEFDTVPEIVSDRTFVPMRAIFEALGAEVNWNGGRREAVAEKGYDEVILKIGSTTGISGSTVTELDAAPYIKDSRTMVPLRFLSESLGYDVSWDNDTRSVYITSDRTDNTVVDEDSDESGDSSSASGSSSSSSSSGPTGQHKNGDEILDNGSKYILYTFHEDSDQAVSINDNDTDLSYASAVMRYNKRGSAIRQAKQNVDKAGISLDEFELYLSTYVQNGIVTQTHEALKLASNWVAKAYLATTVQQGYSITSKMDNISLKLAEIQMKKDALDYAKKTRDTTLLKFDAGMASRSDLDNAERKVKTAEQDVRTAETALTGLYVELYGLLDYKQGDYAEPEFSLAYEPIGDVDLEDKYTDELRTDPYIWYIEHSEANAKLNLIEYEYNLQQKSHKLTAADLDQARMNTNVTKEQLRTAIYTRYNNILQLEDGIATLENQLETLRSNIDTARTSYDAGMISRSSLEDTLQNISTLKYNLLSMKVQHQQLVAIFNTPYLAPDYMYAGA